MIGLAAAHTEGAGPPTSDITRITLERRCFGCAFEGTLVLRRDGTATLTRTGNARFASTDRVSTGKMPGGEFERLARLVVENDFFSMDEVYQDPDLRDGATATLRVERRGVAPKAVFRREDAGPDGLKTIEQAIDALQVRTRFVPAP